MSPPESASGPDPLDRLAEEFLGRFRRGERPSLGEYTAAYPELAEDIRDLFPALVEMERVKSSACGPVGHGLALSLPLSRLGDYQILGVIGHGGMGIVYEALRESLRSRVALKVMHPRYRDHQGYLRRFHVEARAAARLHHTNIVSVFDYGEADGLVYYAMPLIAGHSLEKVLDDVRLLRGQAASPARESSVPATRADDPSEAARTTGEIARGLLTGRFEAASTITARATPGPNGVEPPIRPGGAPEGPADGLPIGPSAGRGAAGGPLSSSLAEQPEDRYHREVARLGAQVADALAYAHKRGVLHRDIKPSNLLLDALGNVWVTDFGLAKLEDGDDLSQSRDIVGTMRYMSPERFRSVSDHGADLYALGATLYELVTLRPAFEGRDQIELMNRIAHEPPIPPRQHDRRIPRDLETIILKALAKDPKDRFAGAGEMAAELRRFVENRPIRSRSVPGYEQLWRWCKRNPSLAAVNGLAATLIVAIAVVASLAAVGMKAQRDEAHRNLVRAYASEMRVHANAAEVHRLSRRAGQRFETLASISRAMALAPAAGGLDGPLRLQLRNEAIAALALPDLRVDREIDISWAKRDGEGFILDRDFARYAISLDDGTVVVRRVADDRELARLPGIASRDDHRTSGFSLDGRYLAMSARNLTTVQVWDLTSGRLIYSDPGLSFSNVPAWDFHPGGRELAVAHADGSVAFIELPSGRTLRYWPPRPHAVHSLAFSADGSRLALASLASLAVSVCATESGRSLAELEHPRGIFHVAWNPRKPDVLAAACEDNAIYVWDVGTSRQTTVLRGDTYNGLVVAFHPGGELLVSRGWHAVLRLWDTRTGQQILSRQSLWRLGLSFDRDGRRLAVDAEQHRARILELAEGECRTLVADPFAADVGYTGVAVDDAGRRLAASATDGISLWDVESGMYLGSVPSPPLKSPLFDSSGALLTTAPLILRWPIHYGSDGSESIGPPQFLGSDVTVEYASMSRDGSVIALPQRNKGALVFGAARPMQRRRLRHDSDIRTVAVSPDGRWVVTGSNTSPGGLHLWDARSGRLVHSFPDLPRDVNNVVSFSPDGRWLLAYGNEGGVLVDTVTWKRRPGDPNLNWAHASPQFTPDSRMIALATGFGGVALLDLEDGHEVARFEDPQQCRAGYMAFSRDGTRLIVSAEGQPKVRVWDIQSIRRRLAGLGLDWDPPPARTPVATDPGPTRDRNPRPLRVDRGALDDWLKDRRWLTEQKVAQYDEDLKTDPDSAEDRYQRGLFLARLNRHAEAVADFSRVLGLARDDARALMARGLSYLALKDYDRGAADLEAVARIETSGDTRVRIAATLNNQAWTLLSEPVGRRDIGNAVALARRALALSTNRSEHLNTLGVALYRAGDLAGALPILEESLAASRGRTDGFDLLFLAMTHQRLGHCAEARDCYDRALHWRREPQNLLAQWNADLDTFQAEARALLGDSPPELPADVFAPR